MLCYSDLVVAFFEAQASDPVTAASTGRFYLNTTSHVVKWYANSAWHTAMDLDTAQTATNKTFTSPVINSGEIDNSFVDGYLDFNEESAPSTPSSGKVRLYAKTDKKFWYKDSAGVEAQFGASGSGELNLIENPSDATNWSSTGWSSAAATTTTAGDLPLGGIVDTAIQITSDTSAGTEAAEYVSYSFTTPASLATKLKVEFWMRPGSNFIASEWTVSVYQSTTRQALSTDSSSVTYLPNAAGKFTTTFDCAASTAYTLRFARPVNAGANAGVLNIANVVVGPGIQPQGAVVSGWLAFTSDPAPANFGTVANSTWKYRRIGDSIHIKGSFQAGTRVASTAAIALPSGMTLATTATAGAARNLVGQWYASGGGSPTIVTSKAQGALHIDPSANTANIYFAYAMADGTGFSKSNATNVGGADSEYIAVDFTVPIAEWAGSGTLNVAQNDVEYAYNTSGITAAGASDLSAYAYGPAGVAIGSIASTTAASNTRFQVQWQRPRQNDDEEVVEFYDGTGWFPVINRRMAGHAQGTSSYGVTIEPDSATKSSVYFYNKGCVGNNATYAGDGSTWASISSWKWRAKKKSAGAAVGFGAATQNSLGLVRAGQVPGTNTNDSAAAGYVGEILSQSRVRSSGTSLTTATAANITATALTLTAGDWDVTGSVAVNLGAATTTIFDAAVSTVSATMPGNDVIGVGTSNEFRTYVYLPLTTTSTDYVLPIPTYRVSVASSTTFYLVGRLFFSAGTAVAYGSISARRVR